MSLSVVRRILLYQQSTFKSFQRCMSITKDIIPDDRDLQDKGVTVTMLSQEGGANIYIEKYSDKGFKLNTGFKIDGPCVFFPRSFLSWKISGVEEVNADSLSLFSLITPKLDLLVLGIGNHGEKVDPSVLKFLREKKINFEILTTEHAIATFNFLNTEQRWVAAGMIPPRYVSSTVQEDIREHLASQRKKDVDYLTDDDEDLDQIETDNTAQKLFPHDNMVDEILKKMNKELPDRNAFGFKIIRSPLELDKEVMASKKYVGLFKDEKKIDSSTESKDDISEDKKNK